MSVRLVVDINLSVDVFAALRQYETELVAGALVVVEIKKSRVRVLPL